MFSSLEMLNPKLPVCKNTNKQKTPYNHVKFYYSKILCFIVSCEPPLWFLERSNCIAWSGWTVQAASSSERKQGSQVAQRGFIGMHVSGEQLILAQLIIRHFFFLHIAKEPQMVEVWIFSQKWLWEQRQKKQLGFFSTYTWPHLNFCKYWSDESNQKNLCYLKFYQRLTNGWGGIFLTKPGYCP